MWRILDNTVLSNFAATRRSNIVLRLWPGQVCTTPGVLLEYQNAVVLRNYPPDSWKNLPVLDLTEIEQAYTHSLPTPLGPGERECIAVAIYRQGSFASDDGQARAFARARGIEISGTLGILLACSELGIVTFMEANRLLKKMIAAGYHSPVNDLRNL